MTSASSSWCRPSGYSGARSEAADVTWLPTLKPDDKRLGDWEAAGQDAPSPFFLVFGSARFMTTTRWLQRDRIKQSEVIKINPLPDAMKKIFFLKSVKK
jgi:hypothetical protein